MPPTRVVNVQAYPVEPYDILIGRGTPFGNPFIIGKHGTREQVINRYRQWIFSQPLLIDRVRKELRGKVLGCYCTPEPCHGNVLVEIAES